MFIKHYKSVLYFVFGALRPFFGLVILQGVVSLIWALDLSLRPYLMKVILDRITSNTSQSLISDLIFPIIIYLFSFLVVLVAFRIYDFVIFKRNPSLRKNIFRLMFDVLLDHSSDFFQNNLSGEIVNKINDLANSVPALLTMIIDRFIVILFAFLVAIYTVSKVNILFVIYLVIWIFSLIIISLFFATKMEQLSLQAADLWSTVTGYAVDVIANVATVRLFVGKNHESSNLNSLVDQAVNAEEKFGWFLLKTNIVHGISFLLLQTVSVVSLAILYKSSLVTVGDFVLILSINNVLSEQLSILMQDFAQASSYWGKISQGVSLLNLPIDIKDSLDAKTLEVTKGEIVFQDVVFHYKDTKLLFSNKTITIEPGTKIGLVGRSGSGKTTFVNLILRLFDLKSGFIKIDNQNIATDVTQNSLRKAVSVVPQDMPLFHRSLIENIRYGNLNATDEDVVNAAKKAHAHDFIMALPQGYNSLVGERGLKLSGGQRQRIAIARAILKNGSILIFDEATSALDNETEALIQDSLWSLMQDRTSIVIAHRLSTLQWLDKILVFDNGMIVEEGSHKKLLSIDGVYKKMWHSQIGSFLVEEVVSEEEDLGAL